MLKTASTNISLASAAVLTALASIATLGGCVDAREAYDDYGARLTDASTVEVDGEVVSVLPNVDGDWNIWVHPAGLTEDRIISFRGTFTMTAVTANTGLIDMSAQPLTVTDGSPVGEAFTADDTEVKSDATFEAPLVGTLPAEANPVTGANAPVDATMNAQIRSENFLCGTLTGQAGALPLQGTTWAARRVDDPAPMVWTCE